MKKNDEIILEIDGYASTGSGVGHFDGMAVFVPLTAKGDTVRVKILKVKKAYAYGKAVEIINAAIARANPDCEVFSRCGGCVYRHISYAAECEIKQDKVYNSIKRIGGIDMKPRGIIGAKNVYGYRNKAQYPISENGNVGFFGTHSHRVIENENCLLQPEIFANICTVITKWIKENNISIYNEKTHTGLVRHIYLRQAAKTSELMAVLVINGDTVPNPDVLVNRLKNLLGENLKSVQLNINKKDTNVILGDKCVLLFGDTYITDILCGVKVRISPLSFYQVNRDMAEVLYEKAAEYAETKGKTVLDLYCGAGTIGLSMAKTAKKIIGAEIIPDAVRDAKINAEINGINNAEFICADAAAAAKQLAERGEKPDVVIVDPPRKGCDEELLNTIANDFSPERIVYVSCDSSTLARDIAVLSKLGYKLAEYTPVDLFPRTAHVECAALLRRIDINP